MTDIENAGHLFEDAGLAFPAIAGELAARLKERSEWVFSNRKVAISTYDLRHYLAESEEVRVEDYLPLDHSGHGVNSFAIQYYLVQGPLHIFLHLDWDGAHIDANETVATLWRCFSMADIDQLPPRS